MAAPPAAGDAVRSDGVAPGWRDAALRLKERSMTAISNQPELITREGHARLTAELEALTTVRRQELADALRDARADGGDPAENPAVAEALSAAAALERRIDDLTSLLAGTRIAEPPRPGVVDLGQSVVLRFSPTAAPKSYQLVGPLEADLSAGRISNDSPVGSAIAGRQAGDRVSVDTPGGSRTVEIVSVGDEEVRRAA
jgi:transcription elongation factor GreA